ncbi:putative TonB-dependent cobalamin receptor [Arcobacter venerupis]|uniref:TonB-dependent cobalamin receptor n=1 Tax=Arcobacter venerupis TaxID=1054033 RepID=A0AAE7B868_9BACT|nr:TonB-dependent receptor plug domain-containing protein [Arcobacter venerupis]QKF67213.1 putative TonB-dependent cobalamin receptor [Arcobacter venerupis]RWS48424.1 TonB-dependent receptor [Arcobacter venerupis]
MKIYFLLFFIFHSLLFSNDIDNLLQQYNTTSEKSLQTIDEKLGHVFIYSQKDIQLMQYNKLNDVLKELPLINFNKNRFGVLTVSPSATKAAVSGFLRIFINDHEVSSIYTQSASTSWGDLPLDFIDHIEIYYGESSFSNGTETGIYFIRLYTKKGMKENGTELNLKGTSKGSSAQSLTNSKAYENGWSHLVFFSSEKNNESTKYKENKLNNDATRKYLFLNLNNETTDINMAYNDLTKDNYTGLAYDSVPDDGEIIRKDFYVDVRKYFLNDNSLKLNLSLDVNNMKNEEVNQEGMDLLYFSNSKELDSDLKLTKLKADITKSYEYGKNNFITGLSASKKRFDKQNVKIVKFSNQVDNLNQYADFDEEQIISFMLEDDYKLFDNLILIGNAKVDKYKRTGFLDDITESLYRVGAIYTPYENFGLKTFYTKTYLPPAFYNIDYAFTNRNLDVQEYKYFTIEGVYTTEKQKFRITHHNVQIDDFLYYHPKYGFMNISDRTIKTEGFIYSYDYQLSDIDKLSLNYFATKISENVSNSDKGANIKYMGEYDKFEYFTSLIYRNAYTYADLNVDASYNISLGTSYNINKNLKISLKGENLLDSSTQSIFTDSGNNFVLDDYERVFSLSMKWMF